MNIVVSEDDCCEKNTCEEVKCDKISTQTNLKISKSKEKFDKDK